MNKVTIINLNGKAYQLEEGGYATLKAYLEEAEQKLAANPDRTEIMADFEQAIAEKADARLHFQKTVVTEAEVADIIREMGPVENQSEDGDAARDAGEPKAASAESPSSPKRFYRIREGSVIGGVCTGLAAYFNIDIVIVRIAMVILALVTHGLVLIAYLIAMIAVPMADTDEKLAAAYGVPFNAQELMDRARTEAASAKQRWHTWRKNRRNQWREAVRHERTDAMHVHMGPSAGNVLLRTMFGLIAAALTIAWLFGLVMLFATGSLFGFFLAGMPIWIIAILFTIIYGVLVAPFDQKHWGGYGSCGYHCHGSSGGGFLGLLFLVLGFMAIYHFVPGSQPMFHQVGDALRQAANEVQRALAGL